MATQIIIRIVPQVKDRFSKFARMEGKTASQMVRELTEDYIKERNIGIYIDDLWGRIGGKLRFKGVQQRDVRRQSKKQEKSEDDILGLTEDESKDVYWTVCELVKALLEKARSV